MEGGAAVFVCLGVTQLCLFRQFARKDELLLVAGTRAISPAPYDPGCPGRCALPKSPKTLRIQHVVRVTLHDHAFDHLFRMSGSKLKTPCFQSVFFFRGLLVCMAQNS